MMVLSEDRMGELQNGEDEPKTIEECAYLDWLKAEYERQRHEDEMRELERQAMEEFS